MSLPSIRLKMRWLKGIQRSPRFTKIFKPVLACVCRFSAPSHNQATGDNIIALSLGHIITFK